MTRLAVAACAAALMLAGCSSHKPETSERPTGSGWAPFPVISVRPTSLSQHPKDYSPAPASRRDWRICAVLPGAASPLLPIPSTSQAISYGLRDQAQRQHVSITVVTAANDADQVKRLTACSSRADALVVYWADPTRAALGPVLPTRAQLHNVPLVVVGAPTGSYAASQAQELVAEPFLESAVAAAQWALGSRGGVPGTVVVLPGPRVDGSGAVTQAVATAGVISKALQGTSLKVAGIYYAADTVSAQRAATLRAMSDHPGLTYVIGTTTAAQAAGSIFEAMNTSQRPAAVSIGITPKVDDLITTAGVAAAISGSPVIQGRIALDYAISAAAAATYLTLVVGAIAPAPIAIDSTNVATSPKSWWQAPTAGSTAGE